MSDRRFSHTKLISSGNLHRTHVARLKETRHRFHYVELKRLNLRECKGNRMFFYKIGDPILHSANQFNPRITVTLTDFGQAIGASFIIDDNPVLGKIV
jgi:hypothetical protein